MAIRIKYIPMLFLLASCAHVAPGAAVPETISLKGGSTFTHEPGEPVKQVNTALVEVLWRLKK